MEILALFDIDKTLLRVLNAHFTSFSAAFNRVYGVDADIGDIRHDGMTDQQIIIEILRMRGVGEKMIRERIDKCMKEIVSSFNESVDLERVVAMEGVPELLKELNRQGILMGLVTGNLEPIAKMKVRRAGIGKYFKIGGYGSDDIDRARLVGIAIQRAEKYFGFRFDGNVSLFGDSPQDMSAGKKAGVRTIGVTTGIFSKEQLEGAGADFILTDLKDTHAALKILIS